MGLGLRVEVLGWGDTVVLLGTVFHLSSSITVRNYCKCSGYRRQKPEIFPALWPKTHRVILAKDALTQTGPNVQMEPRIFLSNKGLVHVFRCHSSLGGVVATSCK